ncbi:DUF2231 domain-containing protein [Montanilutibacter psychrotolerans]|uniref:DUF2231 domain-containing protein n=1 Tax=Montanilutibacter psychrotolerans TaxID=1327343 RepID=A0A3M8SY97_9GAMM|nr:DUF2231 domain-containing protein [Lysobacter psychrotolerans]RNF86327.1 DUF2231 domain-containing protein [Lysobacter psychrotolerans]
MTHPLHPALVHFPIACWSLATAADIASLRWAEPAWRFAGTLMAIGVVIAIAAMAAGLVELRKIGENTAAMRDANRHLLLAMAAWFLYATSLFLRLKGMSLTQPDALCLAFSVAGFLVLCATGWLGGKLVYVHGLGGQRRRQ